MDDVYKFYNRNASAKVHIKEYFDDYRKLISDCFIPMKRAEDNLMEMMGVQLTEEEMSTLTEYCRFFNICKLRSFKVVLR